MKIHTIIGLLLGIRVRILILERENCYLELLVQNVWDTFDLLALKSIFRSFDGFVLFFFQKIFKMVFLHDFDFQSNWLRLKL